MSRKSKGDEDEAEEVLSSRIEQPFQVSKDANMYMFGIIQYWLFMIEWVTLLKGIDG